MRDRAAYHTISGLHYQFDKSIIAILAASGSDPVTLEGVEDIDLSAEYIQCKYHAAQEYYRSTVQSPILAFLQHYAGSSRDKTYTLYAYFKDRTRFRPIDLDELKNILGPKRADVALTDDELSVFISNNFRFVHGEEYEAQLVHTVTAISEALGCTDEEVTEYYYKNSLHEVIRLSRKPRPEDRTTTRAEFLATINRKRHLYSIWLCQLDSRKNYIQHVKSELRMFGALSPTKNKFVYIDRSLMESMGESVFFVLCEQIVDRFFKVGNTLKNALPMTLVVDVPVEAVVKLKAALLAKKIPINDGYEHVSFQPWYFNRWPVINTGQAGGRANDIINVSAYQLRMITRYTYDSFFDDIAPPDTFITTGMVRNCPKVPSESRRHIHLHSPEYDKSTLLLEVLSR